MDHVLRLEHDVAAVRLEMLDVEFDPSAVFRKHFPEVAVDGETATAAVADLLVVMEFTSGAKLVAAVFARNRIPIFSGDRNPAL